MLPEPALSATFAIGSKLVSFAATDAPVGGWSPLRMPDEGVVLPPAAVGLPEAAVLIWGDL